MPPPDSSRPRPRFLLPAALAVTMISCPKPVTYDPGSAEVVCTDAGFTDGGQSCDCDCTACQAYCVTGEFLEDGGIAPACACDEFA